jgi:hypothetical protein
LQVSISDAIVAQCSVPPSEPANSAFFRLSAIGRIERSTALLSSSMRPSSMKRVPPNARAHSGWPRDYGDSAQIAAAASQTSMNSKSLRIFRNRVKPRIKNIPLPPLAKSPLSLRPSTPARGAYRDRHGRGVGCGGRSGVGRDRGRRAGSPVSDPTSRRRPAFQGLRLFFSSDGISPIGVAGEGAAYGEVVWFWHPLLMSSQRRRVGLTGLRQISIRWRR